MKFRHTNFMRLIYATLLALPFVAILSRVIYVQSNKNAYQSAEINTIYNNATEIKGQSNAVNTVNDLIEGNYYSLEWNEEQTALSGTFTDYNIYFEKLSSIQFTYYGFLDIRLNVKVGEGLNNNNEISNIDANFTIKNTDYTYLTDNSLNCFKYLGGYNDTQLYFNNLAYINIVECADNLLPITYDIEEVESTTLDNVFEYSVNKFIENNNFGKINLFQWTTNLFFDSNDVNNMYVGFINWYLNYTLLVSATYILFLVLMWFINYARRLLERGMNYDW